MAIEPLDKPELTSAYRLEQPRTSYGALVASWVRDDRELYWLAPRTPPPLTEAKVHGWRKEGRRPLMLRDADDAVIAYAELNLLDRTKQEYWIGHVLVDPARRGRGVGTLLTRILIARAANDLNAKLVSLVVFPENEAAIRSYRAAGMHESGRETHYFSSYRRHVSLLRFEINFNRLVQ